MARVHQGQRGFALIEALLSIALLAIILGALATVTSQWLPNWARGIGRIQQAENIAASLRRIGDDLASAEFLVRDPATKFVQFEGQKNSVTLVRTMIGPNNRPGLDIVRYRPSVDRQEPVIIREHARWTPSVSVMPAPMIEPVVTLRGPYVMALSYAGTDQTWQKEWRDRTELPKQIRVEIRDSRSSQRLAISTVVTLHVDAPAECVRVKSFNQCIGAVGVANQTSSNAATPANSDPL